MKKLLLVISSLLSAGLIHSQTDCSDLFISEYVEGWNNNKSMELYNPTSSPITLDGVYRLIRWSNGSTTSDQDPLYVLPLPGTIPAFGVMVMIQDTTDAEQDTMVWPALRKKATWCAPYDYGGTTPGGNVVFWNGDDAISLQKKIDGTWTDIDIFGEIGVRPLPGGTGTLGAWTDTKPYWTGVGKYLTMNKTLVRKHTVRHGVDRQTMIHYGDSMTGGYPNSFYALLEYDSLPANTFDSLGQHWCDCKNAQGVSHLGSDNSIIISPNPVIHNRFEIRSALPITNVEVLSMTGHVVYSKELVTEQKKTAVLLDPVSAGIYLVKVIHTGDQQAILKIIIQ